jgi:hypothetical protein
MAAEGCKSFEEVDIRLGSSAGEDRSTIRS